MKLIYNIIDSSTPVPGVQECMGKGVQSSLEGAGRHIMGILATPPPPKATPPKK